MAGGPDGGGQGHRRGVWGYAASASDTRGVFGQAGEARDAHGGYFESIVSHGTNYGVRTTAAGGVRNYGIYSSVPIVHRTGMGPNWAGYFDGDCFTTSSMWFGSDKSLKKDIKTISASLDIINRLNPVSYFFDQENKAKVNVSFDKQYGFISQEVKGVLPELTKVTVNPASYDKDGNVTIPESEIMGINYIGFIAILTKGIQEQQKQIDELKAVVAAMQGGAAKIDPAAIGVVLSDKNTVVLNQNVPNPFAENTVISYSIPQTFTRAQLMFRTSDGTLIKTLDITQAGKGSVTVFADDLSKGTYTYSLVIDGREVDSKKMVKQ
jgi:hypothetical protein